MTPPRVSRCARPGQSNKPCRAVIFHGLLLPAPLAGAFFLHRDTQISTEFFNLPNLVRGILRPISGPPVSDFGIRHFRFFNSRDAQPPTPLHRFSGVSFFFFLSFQSAVRFSTWKSTSPVGGKYHDKRPDNPARRVKQNVRLSAYNYTVKSVRSAQNRFSFAIIHRITMVRCQLSTDTMAPITKRNVQIHPRLAFCFTFGYRHLYNFY